MDLFYEIGSVSVSLIEIVLNSVDDSDLYNLLRIHKWRSLLGLEL